MILKKPMFNKLKYTLFETKIWLKGKKRFNYFYLEIKRKRGLPTESLRGKVSHLCSVQLLHKTTLALFYKCIKER